jgi:hypothetical protein
LLNDYKLIEFVEYFRSNYIGNENKSPLYEIEFWNCYNRVIINLPRTTNCLEAWHRSLNFKCVIHHLNLGKYLEILIQENERIRVNLIQTRKFIDVKNKDLIKEEMLRIVLRNYKIYSGMEYYENLYKIVGWKFN